MNSHHTRPAFAAVVILAALAPCLRPSPGAAAESRAEGAAAYRTTRQVALGAPDRWDYVVFEPVSHRVFVAHGDRVSVVDGDNGNLLGEVGGLPGGTHGIAFSAATGRGYTDDGRAGIVAAFDLKTLQRGKTIAAEKDADGMLIDPSSGHLFVVDGDSGKVTVIDPGSDTVVATVAVGAGLEYAAAGGNGKVYVNGEEKQEIVRIDSASNRVDARWPLADCVKPHGLDMDPRSHRLFVSCVNSILVVLDADDGHAVARLPIGRGSDAVVFDEPRHLIFSSNGLDGTLSIIREKDANTYVDAGTIKTAVSGRTMAVDPRSGRVYVAAASLAPSTDPAHPPARPAVVPGSLRLLFLDPVK